jgi:hypothetical protein
MTLIVVINLMECEGPLVIYTDDSKYFKVLIARWVGLKFDWMMEFNLN